jgi:hypothetical protein
LKILKVAGNVCGVVLKHPNEKILYVAGDTIWYEGVQEAIDTNNPEIIVVNVGEDRHIYTKFSNERRNLVFASFTITNISSSPLIPSLYIFRFYCSHRI